MDTNGDEISSESRSLTSVLHNALFSWVTQFKIAADSGNDIPVLLRGAKDRTFALGPELKVFIPQARLTLVGRVLPEFGARVRTRGTTISFAAVYTVKALGAP